MKSRIRSIAVQCALCIAVFAAVGCGGDKDKGDGDDDGKSGTSGNGSSGKGGKIIFEDAGDSSTPITCGDAKCEATDDAKACCYEEKSNRCGIVTGSGQCAALSDPRCPELGSGDLNGSPSCCTKDGNCGVDLGWVGQGCIDLGDKTFRSLMPDAPEARRCDAADAGD